VSAPLYATGVAGDRASRVHVRDPRAKVAGLLGLTLVAVTAPLDRWPVYAACAVVLVAVAAAGRVPARTVWRRARIVAPVVVLAAASVPFVHPGPGWSVGPLHASEAGLAIFAAAAVKASLGAVSAVLLGATTAYPAALDALRSLRVPATLLTIAAVTYRYLFVLADEARRLRVALASRGHSPRHALQTAALGRAALALFLRAHARGERVHRAMAARGWRGTLPATGTAALGRADVAFAALVAGVPLATRLALEVGA
jgi:cobalt/nickel transport system permease protein